MKRNEHLLFAFAIVLIALWVLGLVNSYLLGGLVHLLLIIAISLALVRVFGGRRRS